MKNYRVTLSISQKLPGVNTRETITFDFGDEVLEARQFAQMAEKALDREGKAYCVALYEAVDRYEK